MPTRDMATWETAICKVVSEGDTEEIVVRGHRMSELIGKITFAEMMFLMLQGKLPTAPQALTLDALLVASIEHGIAPPSMIARCFASYGTTIQAAIGAGVTAFGDRMGGLGEQMARLLVEHLSPHLGNGAPSDELLACEARTIVEHARQSGFACPATAFRCRPWTRARRRFSRLPGNRASMVPIAGSARPLSLPSPERVVVDRFR